MGLDGTGGGEFVGLVILGVLGSREGFGFEVDGLLVRVGKDGESEAGGGGFRSLDLRRIVIDGGKEGLKPFPRVTGAIS